MLSKVLDFVMDLSGSDCVWLARSEVKLVRRAVNVSYRIVEFTGFLE